MATRCTNEVNRAQENERSTQAMATRRTDEVYRAQENERSAQAMATRCTVPKYRVREQSADTNRRRLARHDPDYRTHERTAQNNRRRLYHHEMATTYDASDGTYRFGQPCGVWNQECRHGCGYIHLSSSTSSTKKKCCANGVLSSVSENFNEELMMKVGLDELPFFLKRVLSDGSFRQDCAKYNNLFAMAATKVCNYCDDPGYTNRGPGTHSVTLTGRIVHFIRNINSTNKNSCGMPHFVFDTSASRACSSECGNLKEEVLEILSKGLKAENPICKELKQIGIDAQRGDISGCVNLIPTMVNQPTEKAKTRVFAVLNSRRSDNMSLQVTTKSGSVSDVKMNSKDVERLCYPLFHPHGEPGYSNDLKAELSPGDYVMSRLMMPERKGETYLEALSKHAKTVRIDSRTGEPFSSDCDDSDVKQHGIDVVMRQLLRVNRHILMDRLSQYWLLDLFSRVRDDRLSVIEQFQERIFMGQPRQGKKRYSADDDIDEEERRGAGYIDEPKRSSYLPDSVHGSQRHMSNLAKNALVLVSEFGCPHVFLTLTCNPEWPEILSQLLMGQTAFDRPDVTVAVFKSRLDKFKTNIRNRKYFQSREVVYLLHVIEYQYRGLPHAHMVIRLNNAQDTNAANRNDLFRFVDQNFTAEMPRFEGQELANILWWDDGNKLTDEYKEKAVEMVRKHNLHNCAVAVNGCKKDVSDRCRRGYSRTETINQTYLDPLTDRVVYRRRHQDDLKVVPYNLQMMMDWDSHINVEFSGTQHCVVYLYKYLFKGPKRREKIEMHSEQNNDSQDEIKLFIYGQVVCSMGAMWRFYGYQDYPASLPAVCSFKVRTPEQIAYIVNSGQICELYVYFNRPPELEHLKYVEFMKMYNISSKIPKYYQNNKMQCENNVGNERHYFTIFEKGNSTDIYAYIYIPIDKVDRCVRLQMIYRLAGEIYYMRLLLLHKPSRGHDDLRTFVFPRGGGSPTIFNSFQQSAIAHGLVENIDDVKSTFADMCQNGTASQCRSYFVILTLHGYETHAIYDNDEYRRFMYMDYIQFQNIQTEEYAQVLMLRDLERLFRKSRSSLEKYGFPKPNSLPTELQCEVLQWQNEEEMQRQRVLLASLNSTCPNNSEQQRAFESIMNSIHDFTNANREELTEHRFHFIGGPGGTGKSALFKKLHAACRSLGLLITICAATTLAALLFDGAVTAHSLFDYPVEDEEDVDDLNPTQCDIKKERAEFLHEVSVIFWDEFVSNDLNLMEAVLDLFETLWDEPRYFVFVCAGDFAQVSSHSLLCVMTIYMKNILCNVKFIFGDRFFRL